jgi:hypothetical protein
MERAGSGDPALSGKDILWRLLNSFLPELPYFFLQVHFSDGSLHPTHTPFLISIPQVLHGSHPQVWHMETSFLKARWWFSLERSPVLHPILDLLPDLACDLIIVHSRQVLQGSLHQFILGIGRQRYTALDVAGLLAAIDVFPQHFQVSFRRADSPPRFYPSV